MYKYNKLFIIDHSKGYNLTYYKYKKKCLNKTTLSQLHKIIEIRNKQIIL